VNVFDVLDDARVLRIAPPPTVDIADGITVDVTLLPSRTACTVPKVLYERYGSIITDMALTHIMTDPTLKTPPRTLGLIERRAERGLRSMREDISQANAAGVTRIASAVTGFLT
jgi:hypothetical protein